MSEVARIIRANPEGCVEATDDLLQAVYRELKQMAAAQMARETAGHTLQPTALVHEAYLRRNGQLETAHKAGGRK